jgi:putative metalloprotease
MKEIFKLIYIITVFVIFINKSYAGNAWDLRAVSLSEQQNINLIKSDKSNFKIINVKESKDIVTIFDEMSQLNGIRPKLFVNDENIYNAWVYEKDGVFVVQITYPLYEVISKDKEMASYLIGHELAHAYLRHMDKRLEQQQSAEAVNLLAGLFLEIFFQRNIGVVGLGSNLSAIGTQASLAAYSRDYEREADRQGALWASSLGYSVEGQVKMFEFLKSKSGGSNSIFSTHPTSDERLQSARQFAVENKLATSKYYAINKPSNEQIELQKIVDSYKTSILPKSSKGVIALEEFSKKNFEKAFELSKECAILKDSSCINSLGVMYEYGLGTSKNMQLAIENYKSGLNLKYGPSIINYYRLNVNGFTGIIDTDESYKAYIELAKNGSIDAMGAIASIAADKEYLEQTKELFAEVGVKFPDRFIIKDEKLIYDYAVVASSNGSAAGMYALGQIYFNGNSKIKKDIPTAEKYFTDAMLKGNISADISLGIIQLKHFKNKEKANEIFEKNFKKSPISLTSVIFNYCNKKTDFYDLAECFTWSKRGADLGLPNMMGLYGVAQILYGSSDKKIEGYAYANLSKDRGYILIEQFINKYPPKFNEDQKILYSEYYANLSKSINSGAVLPEINTFVYNQLKAVFPKGWIELKIDDKQKNLGIKLMASNADIGAVTMIQVLPKNSNDNALNSANRMISNCSRTMNDCRSSNINISKKSFDFFEFTMSGILKSTQKGITYYMSIFEFEDKIINLYRWTAQDEFENKKNSLPEAINIFNIN